MSRGKDDEKITEPLFPRLHVNDTEKGGPRAPPRNKMALYEQFSIPSQRFNPGALLLKPSSQGSGHETVPLHLHRSTHPAKKSHSGYSNFSPSSTQLEQKNKLDEEDFMVPIFESEIGQDCSKKFNGMDWEKLSSFSPTYLGRSMKIQNTTDKEPKKTSSAGSSLRQEGKSQNEEYPKESMTVGEQSVKSVKRLSVRERTQGPLKQIDESADQEHRNQLMNNFDRVQSTGASLDHESRARSQLHYHMYGNDTTNEHVRSIDSGHSCSPKSYSGLEELRRHNDHTFDSEYDGEKIRGSSRIGNGDRGDDVSETSMVDSVSDLDISPDDVIGIIGQKHFWKARRAIVNQQRVFAVQVFELHRLIKVQRSFAGSPHLLLEDAAYLGKSLTGSAKKHPLEYIVKPSQHIIVKHKDDSDNPNHKMECSAENAVGKTSLSSAPNASHTSNCRPISGNSQSTPVDTDIKMSPWCFHSPPGHQWLIPVMSPSEGLIYKPYPGHGFTGPVCGGCGLPGSNPVMGNFVNPMYGVSSSHHHYPGIGVPPPAAPIGHGYLPPYGMPVISPLNSGLAVEQANQVAGFHSHDQPWQFPGGGLISTPKKGAISNVVKLHESKEKSELNGSTASSPGEGAQRIGLDHEGRSNALPLFPTSPAVHVPQGTSHFPGTAQRARVIKVVPRNAISASESVARIFQSIQEGRKQ